MDGKLTVRHAVIKDAGIGIYADYTYHYPGPVKIHNCTFANNEKGIEWYDPDNMYTENYIDIRNCIFYNTTGLDIHLHPWARSIGIADTLAYNRFYPAMNIYKEDRHAAAGPQFGRSMNITTSLPIRIFSIRRMKIFI